MFVAVYLYYNFIVILTKPRVTIWRSFNLITCKISVTIFLLFLFFYSKVDNDPPVCGQTNDIEQTISLGSGAGGTSVSWTEPTATDVCSQVTLVTRSHAPGDRFTVGTTRVTYIFSDATGNRVTCSFNVVIREGKLGYTHIKVSGVPIV